MEGTSLREFILTHCHPCRLLSIFAKRELSNHEYHNAERESGVKVMESVKFTDTINQQGQLTLDQLLDLPVAWKLSHWCRMRYPMARAMPKKDLSNVSAKSFLINRAWENHRDRGRFELPPSVGRVARSVCWNCSAKFVKRFPNGG